jgi:stage IV sporulation protein B
MRKRLRWVLVIFLMVDLSVLGVLAYSYVQDHIPDSLLTCEGEKSWLDLPSIFETEETVETLNVKLFGVIPVKNVDVKVVQRTSLAPSGEPIGIYVETNGLLVLDTTEIEGRDGLTYAPGNNVLQTGDYILKWNDKTVSTIVELNEEIQKTKDEKVTVLLRRNEEELKVAVRPVLAADQTYKIGVWVREDTQGIGTLTYVTEDGEFGTLGHGITDVDTGTLLDLQGGELFQTKILDVIPGEEGEPGELQGYINMVATNEIGEISKNTEVGVFGRMESARLSEYAGDYMPVAMKQEIKEGKAYIYANLEGKAKKYEIEIEKIHINRTDNKSMEIRVTDKDLLALTGGIVQGMSGSPILQNGKIIGAVTHVLVDDPTRGYGVFIETMLGE